MTACSIKAWCKKRNGHRGACYPFHGPRSAGDVS